MRNYTTLMKFSVPRRVISIFRSMSTNAERFGHFYRLSETDSKDNIRPIVGEVLDKTIDLTDLRPGDKINLPYELTVNQSVRDFWQSAFYSHDRINTSTPYARNLGFQDQVIPFSLMLFLAGSMSHADHAKLQIGFGAGVYHWPAFAGDTFRKRFIIKSLRPTSDGQNSILKVGCEIHNQRDMRLFSCEKYMLFPSAVHTSEVSMPTESYDKKYDRFLNHIVSNSEKLTSQGSQTFNALRKGQLIFHTLNRPLSETHLMQLATLARLTHDKHFNTRKYTREEILVPGGLSFALTCSLASRDLHEVIYEELVAASFPNNLCPGETVSAMTFIRNISEHVNGELEVVEIRTIGVKGMEVDIALASIALPSELFMSNIPLPSQLEKLLKQTCPSLSKKIVCIADRKIYRQAPQQTPFLL